MTHILLILLSAFGLWASYISKRSFHYRVKLASLYGLLLFASSVGLIECIISGESIFKMTILLDAEKFSQPIHDAIHSYVEMTIVLVLVGISILHWREGKTDHEEIIKSKFFLSAIINASPDMICVKDENNRFSFTNEALRTKIFNLSSDESILHKTIPEVLAERELQGDPNFSLTETCSASDTEMLKRKTPSIFLEEGLIAGKYMAIQMVKAPILDKDNNYKGLIAIGRDMTYDVLDHKNIDELLKQGKYRKASRVFSIHKDRYKFDVK